MISDYRCFFCFTRAFGKLLDKENLCTTDKNNFTKQMAKLYAESNGDFSAPQFSRELHHALRHYTRNPDPYRLAKHQSNIQAMHLLPELKSKISESQNPFDTALRLAIAGNIIDFAVDSHYDLNSTITKVLTWNFAIDHSEDLKNEISKAQTILYLGDNAGEIVFDKLFLEHIRHPNVYFAVRNKPIINDATMDDAIYVGMDKVAQVISNGYDAPSTILEHCSEEFRGIYEKADVIISKGQGNLEGLLGKTGKNIFFLLMVKCDVIADALAVKRGDFVVKRNNIHA